MQSHTMTQKRRVGAQAALEHPYFSSALSAAARMCMSSSEAFATDIGSAESSLRVRELGSGRPESGGNSIRQAQEFCRDRFVWQSIRKRKRAKHSSKPDSREEPRQRKSSAFFVFCKDKRASF